MAAVRKVERALLSQRPRARPKIDFGILNSKRGTDFFLKKSEVYDFSCMFGPANFVLHFWSDLGPFWNCPEFGPESEVPKIWSRTGPKLQFLWWSLIWKVSGPRMQPSYAVTCYMLKHRPFPTKQIKLMKTSNWLIVKIGFFMVAYFLSSNRCHWYIFKVKNYNLNVAELRDSTLKKSFPGIFNFIVGIPVPALSWNPRFMTFH